MYTHITFISRKRAEAIRKYPGILISISTPLSPDLSWYRDPIIDPEDWIDVLSVKFHDADLAGRSGISMQDGVQYTLFDATSAVRIFDFLKKHQDTCEQVIVHCDAGISRSAAVAKFISIIYGLKFPEDYSVYNRHVFTTLMQEYGRYFYSEGLLAPDLLPGNPNLGELPGRYI